MNSRELEDLSLILIRDAAEAPMWLDNWAFTYPTASLLEVSAQQPEHWQAAIEQATAGSRPLAVAAHGAGVAAFLHWLYHADILTRGRLKTILLAEPDAQALSGHAALAVCPCPAAVVYAQDAPDAEQLRRQAARWRAAALAAPESGRLNGRYHGWQWGAKLLQEMLLA